MCIRLSFRFSDPLEVSYANLRLRPKLLQELKPGTRVVSNTFDMGDWRPEKEQSLPERTMTKPPISAKVFPLDDSAARRKVTNQATADRFNSVLEGVQRMPFAPGLLVTSRTA
jgi:hypothetical protein